MNIIIVEDEMKAAKSLENIISTIRPEARVIAKLQSIESAVAYFSEKEQPDLIFMDVQLSDGLCFEIFKSVKISSPVIFCTAFDEYSLEAFKANGVDYVLKPFSKDDIMEAFRKVDELKSFFQKSAGPDMTELLFKIAPPADKKSFLVFKHNKYTTVSTDQIAFFYIRNDSSTIMCFAQEEYTLHQSLDQITSLVSAKQFFRLNRQYLINFAAIKEVEHYFLRKLFVKLIIPTPDKLLISKEKATLFLNWLENR